MSDSMINGVKLNDVLSIISKPFNTSELKKKEDGSNQFYLSHNILWGRVDPLISGRYLFTVVDPPKIITHQVKDTPYLYASTLVEFNLFDDDGQVVFNTSAPGVDTIILLKESGRPKNLENSFKSSLTRAKTNCIKELIGPNAYASNYKFVTPSTSVAASTSICTEVNIEIVEGFTRKTKRYSSKVKDLATGKIVTLLIWESLIVELGEEKVSRLLTLPKGSTVCCSIETVLHNNDVQYIVKKLISYK